MTLELRDVSWGVDDTLILDGVSLDARPGRMLGLIGPNGSGKSSLLRCVAALRQPRAGAVRLAGDDLLRMPRRAIARRVAFVEQDASTDVDLDVLEVVLLGRTPHRRALEPNRGDDLRLAREALARTAMSGREHRMWPTLSGGERQRVRIARALVQKPELLLLDEPTNHLDVAHQLDILTLVRDLGLTVVAALHDLNLAAMFCDDVVVLDAGRIVAAGSPRDVLTTELIARVYAVDCVVGAHPVTGTPVITFTPRPSTR